MNINSLNTKKGILLEIRYDTKQMLKLTKQILAFDMYCFVVSSALYISTTKIGQFLLRS